MALLAGDAVPETQMTPLRKGRYTVQPVQTPAQMAQIYALRGTCFGAQAAQADCYDAICTQVMVQEAHTGRIVAGFRMSVLDGATIGASYAAQFYDLSALAGFPGPMLELGRFCIHPDHSDPEIPRVGWAALTAYVDEIGIEMLFGCSSFTGTDPAPYRDAFAVLRARHLAPARWRPRIKAPQVFEYATQLDGAPGVGAAIASLPPLLRTYLMMGGWVSDHAVIDHAMGTLHVFTGLEIGAIPPARKRLLRALV
jgi:putative hemolysin